MKPNFSARFLTAALLAGLLAGCGAGKPTAATDLPVLTGGTSRVWRTDFDRLEFDLRRAVKEVGWGVYANEVDREARTIVMRLQAPNERLTVLTAGPEGRHAMRVTMRVGRLGDQHYESQLLAMLDEKLTGEPGVPRGGDFELPPLQSSP